MKKAAAKSTTQSTSGENHFSLATLALDLLDTAWRIAIPVVLMAILGILADKELGSAPWLTLLGMVIGFVMAGLLLKRQLAAVEREERK